MDKWCDSEWARFFTDVGEIVNAQGTANEKTSFLKAKIDEWHEETNMVELTAMLSSFYTEV